MWVIYRTPLRSLDTNIRRVLHRVFVGPHVPEPAAKEPALLTIAEKLVPPWERRLDLQPSGRGVSKAHTYESCASTLCWTTMEAARYASSRQPWV